MNSIKTLKVLVKLASDLDQKGLIAEANFVDYLIAQVTSGLKPVGEIYEKNGKYYRKFEDPQKGIVIKEVTQKGEIIDNPATTTTTNEVPVEPSFWEKYNPFSGLLWGLSGQGDKAAEEQKASEVPWIEKE